MKSIYILCLFLLVNVEAIAQLEITLTIENQNSQGTDFYFDIYLTRTSSANQGDIYLGNSDFTLQFNQNNFSTPNVSKVGPSPGFCTFKPTASSAFNDEFTRRTYYNGQSVSLNNNIIRINAGNLVVGDVDDFNAVVAKIDDETHAHRLGTFKISGISNPGGTAGLTWLTGGGSLTRVFTLDQSAPFTSSEVDLIAIDPEDIALPIKLSSFTITAINHKAKLAWKTAWEDNNEGFNIQRKFASAWKTIGYLASQGHTTTGAQYEFIDSFPQRGINYYRLEQIDLDGSISNSPIVSVNIVPEKEGIYPNPILHDELYLVGAMNGTYEIFNMQGVLMQKGSSQFPISVRMLSSGTYILKTGFRNYKFIKW